LRYKQIKTQFIFILNKKIGQLTPIQEAMSSRSPCDALASREAAEEKKSRTKAIEQKKELSK